MHPVLPHPVVHQSQQTYGCSALLGNPQKNCGQELCQVSCFLRGKETIKIACLPSSVCPAQAVLKINGLLLCGAVLVDTRWIVTAAHCFDNIRSWGNITVVMGRYGWGNITVVMGRYGPSLASGLRAFSD